MNKHDICKEFLLNPNINPISNRSIGINGPTFNKLTKLCYELKYDEEIDELLNSLILDEKVGLSGYKDIEQTIILNSDLDTIIKLLYADSRLRDLIYELIPIIIKDNDKDELITFINDLIDIKEFILMDRIIDELINKPDIISSSDFDDIVNWVLISEFSPKLENFLFELIPVIISDYIENFESIHKDEINPFVEFELIKLIKKLLYFGKVTLTKLIIENIVDDLNKDNIYFIATQDIFTYDEYFDSNMVKEYMNLIPEDVNLQNFYPGIKQTIGYNINVLKNDIDKLDDYAQALYNAAINLKNNDLLKIIIDVLKNNNYRTPTINQLISNVG